MATTRFRMHAACSLGAVALALSGCASVPRGPALSLANAGIDTTNAFGTEIRSTAQKVQYVDVTEAFVATYLRCKNPNLTCSSQLQPSANFQLRQQLGKAILLRAKAVDALGKAYASLKTEAEYDARGDLVGATNDAIDGVNNFATAIAAIGGAAPAAALIREPLKQITGFGVGLLADRNQRKRLVAGSHAIAQATKRLRDALEVEAFVFDRLAEYLVKTRSEARQSLLDAGLVSNADALQAFTTNLELKPVSTADAVVAKSPAAKQAIFAMLEAQSRADVIAARNKYHASIAALDALLRAHDELETGQSASLADVERFLAELDTALGAAKKE